MNDPAAEERLQKQLGKDEVITAFETGGQFSPFLECTKEEQKSTAYTRKNEREKKKKGS